MLNTSILFLIIFIKIKKENYNYDHEKYNENNTHKRSANGIYKSAAVACDSALGSEVGK